MAFVEVKTRRGKDFGHPVEAVNWRKQRELSRSAAVWMARYASGEQTFRFDVVGVLMSEKGARVRHVENAFCRLLRPLTVGQGLRSLFGQW